MLKVALEGVFTNFKRIFFAADRVTDMDLRNQIATLSVEVDDRVDESACIGCAGCARHGSDSGSTETGNLRYR